MYPELEAAFAAIDAARAAHDEVTADGTLRHDYAVEDCPRCTALAPTKAALREAEAAAWGAMWGSADPLVRWIAKNCEEYRAEALLVTRALPAPMDELDALANREGWCGQWDAFKHFAKQDGVLPAETGAEVSACSA